MNAFKALNDVVAAFYGYKFAAGYVTKARKISCTYLDLRINVTPKVHSLIHYVQQFCMFTGRRLVPWSKQAMELMHQDFKQTWQCFKLNNINHDLYGEHLLKAVSMYNSHLL